MRNSEIKNSHRHERKFQCACIGEVIKLPMSAITLVDDFLIVGMAGAMLLLYLLLI